MKPGIIINSRRGSTRLPDKAFHQIQGVPLIANLLKRLEKTMIPIICAVPETEYDDYLLLKKNHNLVAEIFPGNPDDPLDRMYQAARHYCLDTALRITHDKIFIEPHVIQSALEYFLKKKLDYLYFPGIFNSMCRIDGTAFEIVDMSVLTACAASFQKVEHLAYPFRMKAKRYEQFSYYQPWQFDLRLLIDYKEDLKLIELLLNNLGPYCDLQSAISFVSKNLWCLNINSLPKVSVYTCGYNAEAYLKECIFSVIRLNGFPDFEYLLIDDASTDGTYNIMMEESSRHKNIYVHKLPTNSGIGYASSYALSKARAPYIIRLDADDFFSYPFSVLKMLWLIQSSGYDCVVPDCFHGSPNEVQIGKGANHIGGTLFASRSLNYLKFTDYLRGLEGYDFFQRAFKALNIKYLKEPLFFYRQHDASLSKSDPKERAALREFIDQKNEATQREGFH